MATMRDGVRLATNIYRAGQQCPPADGKFPCYWSTRLTTNKQSPPSSSAARFVARGYDLPMDRQQNVRWRLQSVSPAFFLWNGVYAVATRTDFSLVGKPGLFSGASGYLVA